MQLQPQARSWRLQLIQISGRVFIPGACSSSQGFAIRPEATCVAQHRPLRWLSQHSLQSTALLPVCFNLECSTETGPLCHPSMTVALEKWRLHAWRWKSSSIMVGMLFNLQSRFGFRFQAKPSRSSAEGYRVIWGYLERTLKLTLCSVVV